MTHREVSRLPRSDKTTRLTTFGCIPLAGCGHQRIDHSILELDGEDYRAEPLAEREEEAVSNSSSEHGGEYVEHLARLY